jgi:hypothetical protein
MQNIKIDMSLIVKCKSDTTKAAQDLVEQEDFFCSETWSKCYDARFKIFYILDEKENIVGKFAAFEGGKKGLKTLITPPFAPHIGLSVASNRNNPVKIQTFQKQISEAIVTFLLASRYVYYKLDFPAGWNDMQPMVWKKIKPVVRYTYKLNLNKTEEEIIAGMDSSRRNKINKARLESLDKSETIDTHSIIKMLRDNLQDKPIKLHEFILKNILNLLEHPAYGFRIGISDKAALYALNVCCRNGDTCYNLFSAIDRSKSNNSAGSLSLFESILHAKKTGCATFDFEGSVVPEIEEYFRSFGGVLTPYFTVQGGKWPWPQLMKWR